MATETEKPLPLPRIQGPKLEPFQGAASADLEFLEFLGSARDLDSKVWKVRIDNDIYVLKIVSYSLPKLLPSSSSTHATSFLAILDRLP